MPSDQCPQCGAVDPTGRGMDSDAWFRVPLSGYAPETVMASTYSFADGRLWILDEHKQGPVHFARLVRVHPETGEHELLGAWPRPRGWFQSRLFENHWLAVDQDGGVLVVASSMPFRMHAASRVALDGPAPRVEGIRFAEAASRPDDFAFERPAWRRKGSIQRLFLGIQAQIISHSIGS